MTLEAQIVARQRVYYVGLIDMRLRLIQRQRKLEVEPSFQVHGL